MTETELRIKATEFALKNKPNDYPANSTYGSITVLSYDLVAEAKKIEKYLKSGE